MGQRFCFPIGGKTRILTSNLGDGFIGIAVVVSGVDAMRSFNRDLVHFVGDRVIPIPSQAQVRITRGVPTSRAEQNSS
ncbi:hypothetical protein [Bradyrhizobium sp. CCBAU 51745]|uniref:hypothetical protein n=1 Tax=Bradyrhizobium sp. CCBAU 51745 TaxID=1325099 RepID=UPI002305E310|nr:hypothetical protein [Bradyrhizobium sp. CCBAU 51745]